LQGHDSKKIKKKNTKGKTLGTSGMRGKKETIMG